MTVAPDNGAFMIAGYSIAAIIYLGYIVLLLRRQRALDRRWRTLPASPMRPSTPPPPDVAA